MNSGLTLVEPGYANELKNEIAEVLETTEFPLCEPLPFESQHLNALVASDYLVCEESRQFESSMLCMLYDTTKGHAIFAFGTDMVAYHIANVAFPLPSQGFHHRTCSAYFPEPSSMKHAKKTHVQNATFTI